MAELGEYLYWVGLAVTRGLGARLAGKLLREMETPEAVFRASLTTLESFGLPGPVAQQIHSQASLKEAEKELERAAKRGARLLQWREPAYPPRLLEIYDPPPLLYVLGDAEALTRHAIAIVGTRRPTPYGLQMASRLGRDLAAHGLAIVSGMARGIDAAAHQGALDAKGKTIAVLGCGLDVIYPKENRKLHQQIIEQGAVITEFPFATPPLPENFPIRNRIIAGMSLGTVVVEGEQHSGSLVTARLAMEFSREVYGVPGNVTQSTSYVPNHLIRHGAKLVTGWEDVVEELPTAVRAELFPVTNTTGEERAALVEQTLSPAERTLYDLLGTDAARHIDELVEESALSSSEVLAVLFELEMRGVVRQIPGKQFVRVLL
jgi:DNA processing protein